MRKSDPWLVASVVFASLLLGLIARFGADAGMTWDELAQSEYGDTVLAWFQSGFADRRATSFQTLYLYGGLFDAVAQWVVHRLPFGPFETRHVVTAVVALLGIVGTGMIAARLGGTRAGFFGMVMLALTPAWIGHGLFNPKDVPFGAAAVFATYASVRLATGSVPIWWSDAVWAGLTVGIALAIRAGGVFLLGYPCLAVMARTGLELLRRRRAGEEMRVLPLAKVTLARLSLVPLVAWMVMLSAWPWAQMSPVWRPLEAMAAARHFDWDGAALFAGRVINAHALPASYLPVWFGITLPDVYLVAVVCGVAALARGTWAWDTPRALGILVVLVSVILPVVAAIATRSLIYDAQRHFLFVLLPAAALAGLGLSHFFGAHRVPSLVRSVAAIVFVVMAAIVAFDMVKLHPYEYVYFNRVSGGLPRAYGRFETDYWGASYKEGLAWVVNELPPIQLDRPIDVASCNDNSNNRLDYYRRRWPGAAERVAIAQGYAEADVFLAVTRYDCHKVPGRVLHVVERQGVPLLFVIRTERLSKSAFQESTAELAEIAESQSNSEDSACSAVDSETCSKSRARRAPS